MQRKSLQARMEDVNKTKVLATAALLGGITVASMATANATPSYGTTCQTTGAGGLTETSCYDSNGGLVSRTFCNTFGSTSGYPECTTHPCTANGQCY